MVEILLQKNKIFADLVVSLSAFPDLDKMLTGFITVPKTLTAKTAKISIDTLIYLKQTLKVIPSLAAALHDLIEEIPRDVDVCTLMQALYTNLTSPSVNELQDIVDSAITESTTYSKSAHEMRHQECFALRCGLDGLLDVARKSFLQTGITNINTATIIIIIIKNTFKLKTYTKRSPNTQITIKYQSRLFSPFREDIICLFPLSMQAIYHPSLYKPFKISAL